MHTLSPISHTLSPISQKGIFTNYVNSSKLAKVSFFESDRRYGKLHIMYCLMHLLAGTNEHVYFQTCVVLHVLYLVLLISRGYTGVINQLRIVLP